jgi:hypothetical protein
VYWFVRCGPAEPEKPQTLPDRSGGLAGIVGGNARKNPASPISLCDSKKIPRPEDVSVRSVRNACS